MLLELIKNKNVAIVGPSSFLYNKNMGGLIDSHDVVIKINKFQNLCAKDYGSRTDILFYNFYLSIPDKSIDTNNSKLIVTGHSFEKYLNNKKNFQKSEKIYNKIPHEYYPEEELSVDMKNYINKNGKKSTGFWVISLLFDKIDIMKQLNIFGLDFCINRYNIKYHDIYAGERVRRGETGHNMKNELLLFKKLFQKYKENKKIIVYDKDFLHFLTF